MTQQSYGLEYTDGYRRTVNLLLSRGVSEDNAQEAAQAAWARGWERRNQLRDPGKTLAWVNSIAMNYYRGRLLRETERQSLPELSTQPEVNVNAIDVYRMLCRCRALERQLLVRRYLLGWEINEIAERYGWSQTAVRIRLMRARRNLRRFFERRSPALASRHPDGVIRSESRAQMAHGAFASGSH